MSRNGRMHGARTLWAADDPHVKGLYQPHEGLETAIIREDTFMISINCS